MNKPKARIRQLIKAPRAMLRHSALIKPTRISALLQRQIQLLVQADLARRQYDRIVPRVRVRHVLHAVADVLGVAPAAFAVALDEDAYFHPGGFAGCEGGRGEGELRDDPLFGGGAGREGEPARDGGGVGGGRAGGVDAEGGG